MIGQTRREQWVPAVVRSGQAGLLQKRFTDSSARKDREVAVNALVNSMFCQDCF